MVNFTRLPIKSTKHVSSPCDDGYIYIPVRMCIYRDIENTREKYKEGIVFPSVFNKNRVFVSLFFFYCSMKNSIYSLSSIFPSITLGCTLRHSLTHTALLYPSLSPLCRWHLWGCCIWFI